MNGKPKGFAIPGKLTIERHSQLEKVSSPNVLAVLPGSDPALANEVVVLMAHLDHDGVIEKTPGADKIMNGAMDNAAGTATMLEVARAFAQNGVRPKRTILFAAVTAEEDGLLGAEYLAKNPVTGAGKVVAVVNLDMPLLTYDFTDINAFGAEHSTLGPVVAAAAAKAGVTVSPDPMPEESVFTRSDHYKFVVEGVPAVFLATGWAGPGKDKWADFLKNRYHQVTDQADETFDWNAGAKFARINYLIARDIADAPQAPRWYQGNFFGSTFAKNAPKAPRPK
jgi:Zn-dependent M28 family amino/carboxypeptidase